MMMRVLQAGGLVVDVEPKQLDDFTKRMMREPYGMFENFSGVQAGRFVNSFKLIDSSKFPLVPADYKFIFAGRSISGIEASWQAIAAVYNSLPNANFPIAEKLAKVQAGYVAWQAIVSANFAKFLKLDYDTVCANPAAMAASIAGFINTDSFTFDQSAAIAAVDRSLYIAR